MSQWELSWMKDYRCNQYLQTWKIYSYYWPLIIELDFVVPYKLTSLTSSIMFLDLYPDLRNALIMLGIWRNQHLIDNASIHGFHHELNRDKDIAVFFNLLHISPRIRVVSDFLFFTVLFVGETYKVKRPLFVWRPCRNVFGN